MTSQCLSLYSENGSRWQNYLIYKAQFCLSVCLWVCVSVCFNSSETASGTSIKLGTIDHHSRGECQNDIGDVIMTSRPKMIFLEFPLLDGDNHFLLKRQTASDLSHFKNFHLFGVYNDFTINELLNNLIFVLS